MKILFSLRQIRPGSSGGIALYAKNLAELLALNYPDIELHLVETFYNYKHFCDIPDAKCSRHLIQNPSTYDADIVRLIEEIKPDVVFYPATGDPIAKVDKEKYFVCIADLQHVTYPEFFSAGDIYARNSNFKYVATNANKVITLSEHAKSEITSHYELADNHVEVISPALSTEFRENVNSLDLPYLQEKFGIDKDYIFYPANFWEHKNHINLFKAIDLLRSKGEHIQLVLTGALFDQRKDLIQLLKKVDIGEGIKILGYVQFNEINALMRNTKLLVFPSLFEGFGIPLLEALECKVPVCCSNVASLPEVGEDAVEYFDPTNPESICASVYKLLHDEKRLIQLKMRAEKQSAKFSYEKSVEKLYGLFREEIKGVNSEELILDGPLVSIVTPSFNQGCFIEETIKSVLNQSYKNIEYCVFDGGSTDNSVQILEKYSDQLFFVSESDDGQTDAINKGLKMAKGEYLCYLNSDDTLEPFAVSKIVDFLEKNSDVDVVYGKADYIDKEGNHLNPYETFDWDLEKFKGHCFICQPATMWRRSTIKKWGYFNENLHYVMDYEYWLRIAANGGKLVYLPILLANSRLYEETKTMSGRGKIFEEVFIVSKKHFGKVNIFWRYQYAKYLVSEKYNFSGLLGKKKKATLAKFLAICILLLTDFMETAKYAYRSTLQGKLKHFAFRVNALINKYLHIGLSTVQAKIKKYLHIGSSTVQANEINSTSYGVNGLFSDGWVSNKLIINYKTPKNLKFLELEGRSAVIQELEILIDGMLFQSSIEQGEFVIKIPIENTKISKIELFSKQFATEKGNGRNVSFQLFYTNLFSDIDVNWLDYVTVKC